MNELLDIDNLYSRIFENVNSFYKYHNNVLKEKSPTQWGIEFKSHLKKINAYLKPALVGTIDTDRVNLWFDRVRTWNENIKAIKYRIDQDILEYEAHQDILPEGYYNTELIEDEIRKSGKTYTDICELLKIRIENHIENVKEIKDFINESNTVADFAFINMRTRYRTVLSSDMLKIPKLGHDIPKRDSPTTAISKTEEVIKPSIAARTLPPFEITTLNKIKISRISEKLTSGISPFITNAGQEFKMLFGGPNPPEVIINWRRGKNELHHFIDLLYEKGLIDPSDTKYWEKTSSFFTIKGNPITPDELRTANRLDNKAKKKEIESLFI